MGGLVNAVFGDGESTTNVNTSSTYAPPTQAELDLIGINTKLAQAQLDNLDQLKPYQQQLLKYTINSLRSQGVQDKKFDAYMNDQMDRANKLGPIQDEIMKMQLDALKRNGAATPEQIAAIGKATDSAIAAGSGDIDLSTQRGIGLISDELANSRGLRLSDAPIMNEAGFLVRGGEDQKASLIKNLRAGQASAELNLPLAIQQMQSGIGLSQQNLAQATQQFQADLRTRAQANRMALFGQTTSGGIGIAGVGSGAGVGTLGALTSIQDRSGNQNGTSWDPNAALASYGKLFSGIGSMMASDRRLKTDIKRIGAMPSGLPVYRYKFIGQKQEFIGVMADEAEKLFPSAVSRDEDGYMQVDYSKLQ